jgi:hypothetical protein
MVLQVGYCEKCGEQYISRPNAKYEWCKPCQINYLKNEFTNWTSGNEKIDDFIQEMQLKITEPNDIIFEWIPYNLFSNIKEIGKGGFATVYSAIWKDGPLKYKKYKKEWARKSDYNVVLKCLYNSQSVSKEFLNEV